MTEIPGGNLLHSKAMSSKEHDKCEYGNTYY